VKTFIQLKKLSQISLGTKRLNFLALFARVKPAFDNLKYEGKDLMITESKYKDYRKSFIITRTFIGWKGYVIKNKLANLCLMKKCLKRLQKFVTMKNFTLPI
jgi:hypothetical protein